MKKICFVIFILYLILSCARNDNKTGSVNFDAARVEDEVMDIAVNYVTGKFKESKKTVAEDGIITISDNQIKYVIDPAKIEVGLIDDDENEDAIITISSSRGQYLEIQEHLILIKTDGKFMLNMVKESDMKIMGIKDRIITVEISTRSPNSPLRDCSACKEIVKYQFRVGDLIRME